jgi:AraC-like DNA-binding protein
MEQKVSEVLYNIFPVLLYAIDRNATPTWDLDDITNSHNIMLVYDGKAKFTRKGVTKIAAPGDLIYYQPGDRRIAFTDADAPLKCYAVNFMYLCPVFSSGEWDTTIVSPLPFSFYQKLTDDYLFDRLTNLFSKLTKSTLSAMDRSGNQERSIITEILVLLFQFAEGNRYNYSNTRKVETIIGYMAEHFADNITLHQLAAYGQVSESYLGRIFKNVTGKAPIDYLIDIRINKAKNLLLDGLSVSETSHLVGFNDIYYFSRAFKKHEGISPSAFSDM